MSDEDTCEVDSFEAWARLERIERHNDYETERMYARSGLLGLTETEFERATRTELQYD